MLAFRKPTLRFGPENKQGCLLAADPEPCCCETRENTAPGQASAVGPHAARLQTHGRGRSGPRGLPGRQRSEPVRPVTCAPGGDSEPHAACSAAGSQCTPVPLPSAVTRLQTSLRPTPGTSSRQKSPLSRALTAGQALTAPPVAGPCDGLTAASQGEGGKCRGSLSRGEHPGTREKGCQRQRPSPWAAPGSQSRHVPLGRTRGILMAFPSNLGRPLRGDRALRADTRPSVHTWSPTPVSFTSVLQGRCPDPFQGGLKAKQITERAEPPPCRGGGRA